MPTRRRYNKRRQIKRRQRSKKLRGGSSPAGRSSAGNSLTRRGAVRRKKIGTTPKPKAGPDEPSVRDMADNLEEPTYNDFKENRFVREGREEKYGVKYIAHVKGNEAPLGKSSAKERFNKYGSLGGYGVTQPQPQPKYANVNKTHKKSSGASASASASAGAGAGAGASHKSAARRAKSANKKSPNRGTPVSANNIARLMAQRGPHVIRAAKSKSPTTQKSAR